MAPELPTVAEQGLPGFAIEPWYGVVVPAGTPPDIVAKLAGGLHEVIRAPEIGRRFAQLGYEPMIDTPEQFGAFRPQLRGSNDNLTRIKRTPLTVSRER